MGKEAKEISGRKTAVGDGVQNFGGKKKIANNIAVRVSFLIPPKKH